MAAPSATFYMNPDASHRKMMSRSGIDDYKPVVILQNTTWITTKALLHSCGLDAHCRSVLCKLLTGYDATR